MNVLLFFSEFVNMPSRVWSIWRYEKEVGYMKNQLLEIFFKDILTTYKIKL
jgi:hypothetical protein